MNKQPNPTQNKTNHHHQKSNKACRMPVQRMTVLLVTTEKSLLAAWINTTSKETLATQYYIINHNQNILITVISLSFAINQDHVRF